MIRIASLILLCLAAGNAGAWDAPDFDTAKATQQKRDQARERLQLDRLTAARLRLATARARASQDDARSRSLREQLKELETRRQHSVDNLVDQRAAVRDLYTTARQTASDLIALLRASKTRPPAGAEDSLTAVATSTRPLDLEALAGIWETLHLTLTDTALQSREMLDVQTAPGQLDTLAVTKFGAVVAVAQDRLVEFDRVANVYRARPPAGADQRHALAALSAASSGVIDMTFQPERLVDGDAAIVQSVRESGPIGLIIGLLGVTGLVLLLTRTVIVFRILRAERLGTPASAGILLSAEAGHHRSENSESVAGWLNGFVRREARRTQWGHMPLSVIIGAAPLLGLLGTVTGMILTFHSIRLYGGGDPVLMADGIAEALSTTMLGLIVAIPLLIGQRFLLSRANRHIHQLDTQVLALVSAMRSSR